jgi:hypothetical protein
MLRFAGGIPGLLSLNLLLQAQQDPKVLMARVRERVPGDSRPAAELYVYPNH